MKDVITIGDAMIAFSPSSTGPLKFVQSFERRVGGAELNVAIGCARLGLSSWISRLGKDEFGQHIKKFARGEGIDTTEVGLVEGYATSLLFKELMASGAGRTLYYRKPSPTETLTPDDLKPDYFKQAKILHLTGIFPALSQMNVEVTKRAIKLAKEHGVKIAFDPNIRLRLWSKEEARQTLFPLLKDVDILLAGDDELELLLGTSSHDEVIKQTVEMGIEYTIIKRGENGSIGHYNGETLKANPVPAAKVVDTVGAGDGFDAGFLYGYLQGWSLEKMLLFANTIGSMVVEVIGDNEGLPYLEEVQARLGEIERIER
ncbi:LOW QUALITY PROTEIN: 2-dehydro-3-deoxygluconate kinase [Bacillus sp. JCM 19046]|nr:LOW QUALITY PROTEIN: 2-dehydro-3-deoxygluconate kinase [Bacillus sp. JCM 19045]GAF18186.1 LOW QUALITY PROTEIN: 2-dehydro-3-deoxygluconate kinase [Bacillus sp. JCM 19046]